MDELQNLVDRVKQYRNGYGMSVPEPVDESAITEFKGKFQEVFEVAPDSTLIEFYRMVDGLEHNGVRVYASKDRTSGQVEHGIYQRNELWHNEEDLTGCMLFGESDLDLFAFDKENEEYIVLFKSGGVIETFSSCEEMLVYVMKLMLDEVG